MQVYTPNPLSLFLKNVILVVVDGKKYYFEYWFPWF